MLHILNITLPIYFSIGLGFAFTRNGFFKPADMGVMGRFVMNFALPAMIFNALAQRQLAEILHPGYLLAYGLGSLAVFALGYAFTRAVQGQNGTESALAAMGMACSNSGFVGYPILLQLLGPVAGVGLALSMLVENLLVIPLALALADSGQHQARAWRSSIARALRELLTRPLVWAIVLGTGCAMLGLRLPDAMGRTVALFASASAALALFTNGGSLLGLQVQGLALRMAPILLGKLVLHPLLVGLLLWQFGPLEPMLLVSGLILASMPMMGIYPLLAQAYRLQGLCAAALLATTVASFFSISLILWEIHRWPALAQVLLR